MSRYDAERALEIYKIFTKQTADVVDYLQQAKGVETATRLEIPNLKHAPTSLTSSLEEYLHDPDFDVNRRQYLAQQEAKKAGKVAPVKSKSPPPGQQSKTAAAQEFPSPAPVASAPQQAQPKPVAPDLIDLFESIESEQTHMFGNQQPEVQQMQAAQSQNQFIQQAQVDAAFGIQPQPQLQMQPQLQPQQPFAPTPQQFPAQTGPSFTTGYQAQNPYAQAAQQQQAIPSIVQGHAMTQQSQLVQPNFTGTGFGGYTPSDQNSVTAPPMPAILPSFTQPIPQPPYQQPQQQSLPPAANLPTGQTVTNPFRQSMMTGSVSTAPSHYTPSPPVGSQPKSTNPFARQTSSTDISPTSPPTSFPISAQSTSGYSQPMPIASQSTSGYPQPMPISAQPTMRSMPTGTNPFARSVSSSATGLTVPVQMTGASAKNPFRQSMAAQQNGVQQGTMGGWENLETVPVFPRNNGTNGGTNGSPNGGPQQGEGGW